MTELTFKSIADKYRLDEDDIEELFMFYDTNDFHMFKKQLGYLLFIVSAWEAIGFLSDLFMYIHDNEVQKVRLIVK